MSEKAKIKSPVARRLREARLKAGISQKKLGVLAGIDEFSASARINQYERDKHVPDFSVSRRLAQALGVPVNYLYAEDEEQAALIVAFAKTNASQRLAILKMLKVVRNLKKQ